MKKRQYDDTATAMPMDRNGKILTPEEVREINHSVLAEQYAKVKHERDKVVNAFNTLKTRQREIEEELAELRRAAKEVVEECYEEGNVTTAVITLNGLV